MFVEERQSAIMEELHANGKVKVKELSERFSVSEDLIRKDLSALEAKGLLKKAYGGAVLIRENIHRKIAAQRKDVNQEEKRGIAKAAVDLIQEGDVVFLCPAVSRRLWYVNRINSCRSAITAMLGRMNLPES